MDLLLLLDPELCALPWEALPVLRSGSSSMGRCFSAALLQHLLGGGAAVRSSEAAAATATAAVVVAVAQSPIVPTVDLARLSYIGDPLHEQSEAVSCGRPCAAYAAPLLPVLKEKVLAGVGKEWQAVEGVAKQVPPEGLYCQVMTQAKGMLYYGMGRFLSYMSPKVRDGANFTICHICCDQWVCHVCFVENG